MYYYKEPLKKSRKKLSGNEVSKEEYFTLLAINKMFEFAGYDLTYSDIKEKEEWYLNYEINRQQKEEFKDWFIAEYLRMFKYSKKHTLKLFSFFDLTYGLRDV